MKRTLRGIYYSFPVQLLLLHFKKFQILLLFWFILFSAVDGSFMASYGVDSLYLAPEYLGEVNWLSAGIVGLAAGIFIMSWNITTFILFCRHFKFLATTTNPFLKYCINNFILPLSFLVFYLVHAARFDATKELLSGVDILFLFLGFTTGFILILALSFYYFFRADISISRAIVPVINDAPRFKAEFFSEKLP